MACKDRVHMVPPPPPAGLWRAWATCVDTGGDGSPPCAGAVLVLDLDRLDRSFGSMTASEGPMEIQGINITSLSPRSHRNPWLYLHPKAPNGNEWHRPSFEERVSALEVLHGACSPLGLGSGIVPVPTVASHPHHWVSPFGQVFLVAPTGTPALHWTCLSN